MRSGYITGVAGVTGIDLVLHRNISPAGGDAQENKCPGTCNLFWARKVLEIFDIYSEHFPF